MRRIEEVYKSEIQSIDERLGALFATLEQRGLLNKTLVIVTSDHGEAFYEHQLLEHGLLYNENLRVPLIVPFPSGVGEGKRIRYPVSSMDIVPTVPDLLGVETKKPVDGASLLDLMSGRVLSPRPFYAFVHENGLAVFWSSGQKHIYRCCVAQPNYGVSELFNYLKDPCETVQLVETEVDNGLCEYEQRLVEEFPGVHMGFLDLPESDYRLDVVGHGDLKRSSYLFPRDWCHRWQKGITVGDTLVQGAFRLASRARLVVMNRRSNGQIGLMVQDVLSGTKKKSG